MLGDIAACHQACHPEHEARHVGQQAKGPTGAENVQSLLHRGHPLPAQDRQAQALYQGAGHVVHQAVEAEGQLVAPQVLRHTTPPVGGDAEDACKQADSLAVEQGKAFGRTGCRHMQKAGCPCRRVLVSDLASQARQMMDA